MLSENPLPKQTIIINPFALTHPLTNTIARCGSFRCEDYSPRENISIVCAERTFRYRAGEEILYYNNNAHIDRVGRQAGRQAGGQRTDTTLSEAVVVVERGKPEEDSGTDSPPV